VNRLEIVRERLDAAVGLKELIAAAYAAFSVMRPVIESEQDPGSPYFATFMMAGATAATGRLALVAAPSMQDASHSADSAEPVARENTAEETADLLAELCQLMARRLYDAALTAADAGDREACSEASHHARELCAWFGGDPLP
jgi:hypothetical protein